jgi:hypothetical protein
MEKAQGKRMIVTGLLIAGVALLFTLGSYSNASEEGGGAYFILWGPVAYGLYRAFRGFLLVTSDRSPRASQYTISSPPTRPTPRPAETDAAPAVSDPAQPSVAHLQAFSPAPTTSDVVPPTLDAPSQPGFADSLTPDVVKPAEPDVQQQGGDQSQLPMKPQTNRWPWWAWGGPAVAAVVLLVIAIISSTKVSREDVEQEAADLAFAERDFAETHGHFTDDITELGFRPSSRIDVHVVTTLEENKFCVDAVSGDYTGQTWDSSFSSDGETVRVFSGLCEGPIRRGESSIPPSWLDTSLAEPATPTSSPSVSQIRLTGWLVIPSPSARLINGSCRDAKHNENERSRATSELLRFSTDRAGRDVIETAMTSTKAGLLAVSGSGSGQTCGWGARFIAYVPEGTRTFFIREAGRRGYWGPLTPSQTRGLPLVL